MTTEQRAQRATMGQEQRVGLLPLLLLFYGASGIISLGCAFFAPWFNWGFLACAVLGAAGLTVVLKHHQKHQSYTPNVYGLSRAPLASPWYAFMPLVVIVAIASWQVASVLCGYLFG